MNPKDAAQKAPRRGIAARILLFVAGFALAGGAAALAFFVVNVIDASGNDAVAQATALSAPTAPSSASELGPTSVDVSWTNPGTQLPGATYQATASPGGQTCSTGENSCPISGLSPGTNYTFSVEAVLDNWVSAPVNTASFATLGVTTSSLPNGTVDSAYTSTTLSAIGGSTPYKSWALTTGTLPSGLTLDTATGAITGTPTAAGMTSGLVFTVTDQNNFTATSTPLSITVNLAASTTALSLSSSTATYGSEQLPTFNVTVTPDSPTSPTGTVQIKNGSTVLCTTGSLNVSGQASCSLTATQLPPSGTPYAISATYGGDTNFNGSTSSPAQNLTVNPDTATVTAFSATGSPITYGSETGLTFSATVTAGGSASIPNTDTVAVTQGATTLCTITLTSGTGTCSPTNATILSASGTAYTATATFNAAGSDTNFVSTATNTTTVTVNKATPTTAVTFTTPITYGNETTETFSATVTGVTGGTAPTGTVTVFDGSNPLCTTTGLNASGNQGLASCSLTAAQLSAGTYSGTSGITATFNPVSDPNYLTSSSAAQPLTVAKATPTIAVGHSPTSPTLGQSVTFTATVTGPSGAATPSGAITWTLTGGATTCASSTPLSGASNVATATCVITASTATTYNAHASVATDSNYTAAGPSTTDSFTVAKVAATTTLGTSTNSPVVGQTVTYTATVTGPSGGATPTGTVTFKDGGTTFSCTGGSQTLSGSLNSATATCTIAYGSAGGHTITAVYVPSSDPNYTAGATSNSVTETVGAASTTTAVASNFNPVATNVQVTYTATVSVTSPGSGTPSNSDTVTFKDGSSTITCASGSQTFNGTTATCKFTYCATGTHSITAVFGGDTNYATSTSSVLSESVVTDTNTLTQTAPTYPSGSSGHTVFHGTATSTVTVTIYYCTGTVSSCSSSNDVNSAPATPSGGTWSTSTVNLSHGSTYTSQAYQTDQYGVQLVSNTEAVNP